MGIGDRERTREGGGNDLGGDRGYVDTCRTVIVRRARNRCISICVDAPYTAEHFYRRLCHQCALEAWKSSSKSRKQELGLSMWGESAGTNG